MKKTFGFLLSFLCLLGCSNPEKPTTFHFGSENTSVSFFTNLDSIPDAPFSNLEGHILKKEGNNLEHLGPEDLYGHTFTFTIPDSFANRSLVLTASFKYKSLDEQTAKYAFSISNSEGENKLWEGRNLKSELNKWTIFKDSILIPAKRGSNDIIKLHPFNPNKSSFDIDSITVSLQSKKFPSFLKDVKQNLHLIPSKPLAHPVFESVAVASFINDELVETSIEEVEPNKLVGRNEYLNQSLAIIKEGEGFLFGGKTQFKKESKVNRIALIYKYKGAITEIYRNNGIASDHIYGNEVWLGKEGFKITIDSLNWFCYGNNNISSFQILKAQKLLIVNIDYSQDHPLFHFPELDTIINQHEDLSANIYSSESEKSHFFKISPTNKIQSIPRILKTQNGYQSAFLWTEHADYSDFRLHKVTYYGNENASGPAEATAGFAYHKIPVTKSVFYTVNDTLQNHDYTDALVVSDLASIKKTPGFEAFLDSLHSIGNEICLHTPDFFTSNEQTMEEALAYITQRYGSHSWIDHGYNNGHSDNREDFMCDGLNTYALNLWEKYGIKYFWNGYFEDALIQNDFRSSISRIIPYHGFEDQLPYPVYWANNKTKPGMYSWKTNSVFYPESGGHWNYYFTDKKLNDFTTNYGIEFSHVYPAHTGHPGFWTFDSDSNFIIQPEFETTLQKMDDLRAKGLLQIPTITEFMEHQEALQQIVCSIEENKFMIKNNGEAIKGLTLVIKREDLSEEFIKQFKGTRKNGSDFILWLDIQDNETIEIDLSK